MCEYTANFGLARATLPLLLRRHREWAITLFARSGGVPARWKVSGAATSWTNHIHPWRYG